MFSAKSELDLHRLSKHSTPKDEERVTKKFTVTSSLSKVKEPAAKKFKVTSDPAVAVKNELNNAEISVASRHLSPPPIQIAFRLCNCYICGAVSYHFTMLCTCKNLNIDLFVFFFMLFHLQCTDAANHHDTHKHDKLLRHVAGAYCIE